ncbi:unannotated protein [freshwater metagenome]|uniref:Unannotated protein n=1 Tax=freshwater metagenome TaxID=449393 RepID=A0A6J7K317_9ZZZZ
MGLAEFFDRLVAQALHPLLKFFGAVQLAARVVVQDLDGLGYRCPRFDFVGNCLLLGLDSREFFDAPLQGLFEVNLGS